MRKKPSEMADIEVVVLFPNNNDILQGKSKITKISTGWDFKQLSEHLKTVTNVQANEITWVSRAFTPSMVGKKVADVWKLWSNPTGWKSANKWLGPVIRITQATRDG
eukprot:TRINITY_DN1690_c0_g1_i2.p1 TRINITY_DN1690_c0_g1~~TRINITY_DN1690_c0_g1_i2.p1  ORF type:complete len:107 (+),score=13.51 TRINITY_DN1690_c0_g1_i2:18-338(+)